MSYTTNSKKKVVVFDIDDTIADLHSFILPLLNKHAGTKHKAIDNHSWSELFGISFEECQKILVNNNYISNLSLRTGMVKYWFKACQMRGFTVHFSTHRGHLSKATEQTVEWLEQHPFIEYEKLMVLKPHDRKADHFSRNTIAYFDDSPTEVQYARDKGFNAYLIDQPWNQNKTKDVKICLTDSDVIRAIQWAR